MAQVERDRSRGATALERTCVGSIVQVQRGLLHALLPRRISHQAPIVIVVLAMTEMIDWCKKRKSAKRLALT